MSQWQKGSGTGISRAHSESFKLDLKGDGVVAGLALVGQCSSIDQGQVAAHPPRVKWAWSARSLKCLYTNACSVGNKQEELQIHVRAGN